MAKYFIYFLWTLLFIPSLHGQERIGISGHILDAETQKPIQGATVRLQGSMRQTQSDEVGAFQLRAPEQRGVLVLTAVGYDTLYNRLESLSGKNHTFYMRRSHHTIEEVIVSTGYENYDQKKGTGAVELLDQDMISRSTGMDILGRLENMTSGMYFDKETTASSFSVIGRPPSHNIFLQGVSTLRGSALSENQPLIVLDNFPYEGDLNMINPNDVESISILKDAAAAAIWGAKAGNGVIVITTKKGHVEGKYNVEAYSNMQFHEKPDLYARPVISNSDLIDLEIDLFDKGYYSGLYNSRAKPSLPPVVELLYKHQSGGIETDALQSAIDRFRNQDVRADMLTYMYRNTVLKQFGTRITGGSEQHTMGLFIGYDKSSPTRISDDSKRLTTKLENSYRVKNIMELNAGIRWNFNKASGTTGNEYYTDNAFKYPYVALVDENGEPASIPWDYSMTYLENVGDGRLLDWQYRPLDEVRSKTHRDLHSEFLADLHLHYNVTKSLRVSADYRYGLNNFRTENHQGIDTYYIRNQINRGTEFQGDNIIHHYPVGGMKSIVDNVSQTHWGRTQVSLNSEVGDRHHIRAIVGMDISSSTSEGSGLIMYGYDDERGIFATQVDYFKQYPIFDGLATSGTIGSPISPYSYRINRSVSFYANGTYTFDKSHVLSTSLRRDASNVFGLETNNKWTPLWSVGYAYLLHEQPFYKVNWLPQFKIRTTYGVSGNVDNSMSSLVTVSYSNNPASWALSLPPAATVNRLPNPTLRWEKVKQVNVGIDMAIGSTSRIRSTIDYYHKRTDDLLYNVPINPTLGRSSAVRNVANTETKGVNINLTTINIQRPLQWRTILNFAYNNSWIINTYREYTTPARYVNGGAISEMPGTMVFGLYSYQWGGLDPETGQPRGVVDGEESMDYRTIMGSSTSFDDLYFHGSSRPLYFGALRNDIGFRNLTLSFNISYDFDYFFKRSGLDYAALLSRGDGHADFYKRWQRPGDELITHVPSFVYPLNSSANTFYQNSAILVEKGDHIRLRDIRLEYRNAVKLNKRMVRMQVFGMVNNLGIIWKSTALSIDPKYRGNIPPPRYFSFGLNVNY